VTASAGLYNHLSTEGSARDSARTQGTKSVETVDADRHPAWIAPYS
jgi:hypothetical protein